MTRCLLAGLCLGLVAQLALLDLAASQRGRDLAAAPDGLDQILGDGQPEDIGYGFQRARTASRNARDAPQPEGLLLVDRAAPGLKQRGAAADDGDEHVTSAFRERLAARQRRQRAQLQQQRERELDDILERYMQALFEASRKLSQQQTGAIDVGPDDLTDMETLQFLESLGEDIPGARKRSGSGAGAGPARQYASGAPSPWDWAAPLAWSGYQLRKRSTSPDFQDDSSSEWSDDGAADDDEGVVPGSRLAMLLSQQLFDERYNDPAVKRLLLSKRSLSAQAAPPRRQDAEEDPEQGLQGLEGRAMRRRKKSTRSEPSVPAELVRILGESKPDGELEPPLALPLAAEPSPAPSNATAAPAPMNPIGHAHETDKLAREHSAHAHPAEPAASTVSPNVVVKVHVEHAPPMVSAEGPHSHDSATHAEDKKTPAHVEKLAGSPAGAAAGPSGLVSEAEAAPRDEPLALPRRSRRLAKKSIDWSQYFGIDRRRKKSLSVNDVDANDLDADWLLRHNLMALSKNSKPSNINKRVAIKREGASPDALLLGAWGARQGWDDDDDGDGDDVVQAGRCPAVTRLAESCRAAIGSNDGLLPLCVLYQACHLCGAAMGVPVGSSCETELGRRGADLCATTPTPAREEECRSAVESIVQVYRSSRHGTPDTETCASQPCLAHFFLSAPAVAFAR